MALENLNEQLKAATDNCKEFIAICTEALGPRKAGEAVWQLQQKIKAAIVNTKKLQDDTLAELEGHQKKFYQLRLEIEKSLLGVLMNKGILSHSF
jgi:hypothetical protein